MAPRERILLVVTEVRIRLTRYSRSRERQRIRGGVRLPQSVKPERIVAGQLVINSTEVLLVGPGSDRIERKRPASVKSMELIDQLDRDRVEICNWNLSAWEQRGIGSSRWARCIRTERRLA